MTDPLQKGNEQRRAKAKADGRHVYRQEYIADWPACVDCGEQLRSTIHEAKRPGLWRACGCPGIEWHSLIGGWERHTP
jgi:hypothetical protein